MALLFTLTVVAPRVISNESVKTRITNEFSKATDGALDFDRLRIFLADLDGIERVVNVVTRRLAPHAFTLAAEVEFSGGELAGRLIREHGPRVLTAEDDAAPR